MTQKSMNDHEVVSALADGQLQGDEFVGALNLLESSPDHRATWHAYHAIGDMMRTGACTTLERDNAFLQRLKLDLAKEPLQDSGVVQPAASLTMGQLEVGNAYVPASNDARFRWKAWGGVMSVVAVSFVVWQIFAGSENSASLAQLTPITQSTQAQVQSESSEIGVADDQAVMIRDPRLDALMAAHQQLGGTSAFQNPTGFVRSATFTGVAR